MFIDSTEKPTKPWDREAILEPACFDMFGWAAHIAIREGETLW